MKILKNKKALSPVVASIILIAVTVAVSIAVAAWMGALTFTFMATEELKITNMEFITGYNSINVTMQNIGTSPITVTEIHINNGDNLLSSPVTVDGNSQVEQQVTETDLWRDGNNYQVKIVTSKGNQYYYNAVAPT